MAAFSGLGQDYLDSDAHLVHNDHHAAPDVTTKSRPAVQPETNVAIKIAPGTHDLTVDASFSGTQSWFVYDRRIEAGRCFEVAG